MTHKFPHMFPGMPRGLFFVARSIAPVIEFLFEPSLKKARFAAGGAFLIVLVSALYAWPACTTIPEKVEGLAQQLLVLPGGEFIPERDHRGRRVRVEGQSTIVVSDMLAEPGVGISERRAATLILEVCGKRLSVMYQGVDDPTTSVCLYEGCSRKPYPAGPTEADLMHGDIVRRLLYQSGSPEIQGQVREACGARGIFVFRKAGKLVFSDGVNSSLLASSVTAHVRIHFFEEKPPLS